MHPVSIATMGKYGGPMRRTVTGNPPYKEVTEHEFPSAQVTNVEAEDLNVKINLISDDEVNDGNN